jgi:putative nucleotidyltransferase with HDIG domain
MNTGDLQRFKGWFESYTHAFLAGGQEDRANIALKIEHTRNVCRLILQIARQETADPSVLLLAETAALFHDIGRFPQYAQYKTFRDSVSVNHGRLGAETLTTEKVLDRLPAGERKIILDAVQFHNAFSVAALDNPLGLFCLKLVRDADKLDIWRIFLEFYEKDKDGLTAVIGLGLPDTPEYSEEVVAAIGAKKTASLSSLRSLNDFILLQLSWVFDLSFTASVRILLEKEIIERFVRFLPRTQEIKQVSRILNDYARERLKESGSSLS